MNWILQSSEISKGTRFDIIVEAARMHERSYKVDEVLENDMYSCELLRDNSIPKINKEYRETFTGSQIRRFIKESPVYVGIESTPVIEHSASKIAS